ncbi:hypothetical protein RFI_14446 [Reticulomyxa filosa]|uniref:Uncharacterized protein n=1 Tax=Reticulomyxa filosa TaxID=46433 RepID=X6NBP7_RETFI|nr:hypothetical protein RFI_14446 [Reticulomyxa filosa]|eukprot:ETO22747.1 hypothetical protein RFI_14446 [Reticulomyxa filosa]
MEVTLDENKLQLGQSKSLTDKEVQHQLLHQGIHIEADKNDKPYVNSDNIGNLQKNTFLRVLSIKSLDDEKHLRFEVETHHPQHIAMQLQACGVVAQQIRRTKIGDVITLDGDPVLSWFAGKNTLSLWNHYLAEMRSQQTHHDHLPQSLQQLKLDENEWRILTQPEIQSFANYLTPKISDIHLQEIESSKTCSFMRLQAHDEIFRNHPLDA